MKRLTYIYTLIPLYAVLGMVRAMETWFGPIGALIIGGLVCFAVWTVVWLRLYGTNSLRPELAVLSILPTACYLGLKFAGDEAIANFSDPSWQNVYFFTWCAAAIILILSARLTPAEEKQLPSPKEKRRASGLSYIIAAFVVLYTGLTWMGTAADLFAQNL